MPPYLGGWVPTVIVSPLPGVMGPLPSGRTPWLINGGLLSTY